MSKTDITVIIPVHELASDTEVTLFKRALESVTSQKDVTADEIMVVVPKGSDVEKTLTGDFDFGDAKDLVRVVSNDGKTDFSSQMNYGVSQTTTEWFSILEFDDEYSNIWFRNVVKYREAYEDVEIFMPIVVDVNGKSEFMNFTNEAAWANSFSDELGVLDEQALLAYQNFNIDGIVMKKDTYEEQGGFKSNLKLTFIYEFLLRMTFNHKKVMVIPRFGYRHLNEREGSLFKSYAETMNPVEANWWLAQAKKEYYFPNDREMTYEETN